MRRILIACMILSLSLLCGCSQRDLENAFFENTTKNTIEEAYGLLNEYLDRAGKNLEEYFPRSYQDEIMYLEDGYINAQLFNKERIYRHEFYNYHLSDDRSYMLYSRLYYLTDATFSNGLAWAISDCDTITEGKSCFMTERTSDDYLIKSGLSFFMEGEELIFDFMFTVNQTTLFHYVFRLYQDDDSNDVMEMTLGKSNVIETLFESTSYTKLVFGKSVEEYFCNHCDPDDATAGSLEYRFTEFKEKPYQAYSYETGNIESFIHLYLYNDYTRGVIFDGSTGELFSCRTITGSYETTDYAKFIRNTKVVEYSPTYFFINLQEVLGWDNLVKIDGELSLFQLQYDDDVLSDEHFVKIIIDHSEYPYYENMDSHLSDDVLSLAIFGLQTPYNTAYFSEKFDLGTIRFELALDNRQLNRAYSENYADFMAKINKFKNE